MLLGAGYIACQTISKRSSQFNNRSISNWLNKSWLKTTNESTSTTILTYNLPGNKLLPLVPIIKPVVDLISSSPSIIKKEPQLESTRTPRTTQDLKNVLIENLQSNNPKRALHFFKLYVLSPNSLYLDSKLFRHLNLFFEFRYVKEAFEAIQFLNSKGFKIPRSITCRILHAASNDLVLNPDKLRMVVNWLNEGKNIVGEEGEETTIDPLLISSVLEVTKRMGRPDIGIEVFEIYLKNLPEGEVGESKLWSKVIRSLGLFGDIYDAEPWFIRWRNLYRTRYWQEIEDPEHHPPEAPYLAMLDVFAGSKSRKTKGRFDPSTRFLPVLSSDRLALSTTLFNGLLRLELSRRSYSSLWGLWIKMKAGNWERNSSSWKIVVKAKSWQDGTLGRRNGIFDSESGARYTGKLTGLQSLAGYDSSSGPSSRQLFAEFLLENQDKTSSRIAMNLPSYSNSSMNASTLNLFLNLFISIGDWKSAVIVLECFGVHRIEPDEKTHGIVVLGVVKSWERGLLETEDLGGRYNSGSTRVSRRPEEALGIISQILKQRKMRIALWTDQEREKKLKEIIQDGSQEAGNGMKSFKEFEEPPTPAWMLKKECRDVEYLGTLLRRCGRLDVTRWKEQLVEVRDELLPKKRI